MDTNQVRFGNKFILPMLIAFGTIPTVGSMVYFPSGFFVVAGPFLGILGGGWQWVWMGFVLWLPLLCLLISGWTVNRNWMMGLHLAAFIILMILACAAVYGGIQSAHVNFGEGFGFTIWLLASFSLFLGLLIASIIKLFRGGSISGSTELDAEHIN